MGSGNAEEDDATGVAAVKLTETRLDKPERASKPRVADAPDFGPRYRVIGVLGRGGMGEVYRAYDADMREEVALKVVRSDQAELDAHGRFRREIALARKVTDPNVLRVYDLGEYQGLRYLSMEFVDGESLAAVMSKEKLAFDRALAIFRQVCKGLVAAHAQGVVHRDLKPQNVLVDRHGRVCVADFGLARSIGDSGLTASGAILGSPAYMSPEQVKGEPTDERSDIYSLGVMLYQLVAGKPPFKADTPHALMEMRLHKKPRPLRELAPEAPEYVESIVARCLEVDLEHRYRSVTELLADLDAARAPAPGGSAPGPSSPTQEVSIATRVDAVARKPRWRIPAIGIGVAAAVIAIAVWSTKKSEQPTSEPKPTISNAPKTTPAEPPASAAASTPRRPIPVLVLGIENRAGEPTFDRSLEVVLEHTLRRSRTLEPIVGVRMQQIAADLKSSTDELGPKLAERDKTRVLVMRGTVTHKGQSFTIALTTTDAVTKAVIATSSVDARIEDVVGETARLGSELRKAMGEKVAAKEETDSGLTTSLEAVHEFALGVSAHRSGNDASALDHLLRAVKLDAGFARGHAALATVYTNLHRLEDALRENKLALGALARMSERDQLKFLGDYHMRVTAQTDRSIAAYEELLATWPDDFAAANNLVNALVKRHQITKALEVARRNAKRYPRIPVIRSTHSGAEVAAGNFEAAVIAIKAMFAEFPRPHSFVQMHLAIAQTFVEPEHAAGSFARLIELDKAYGYVALSDFALSQGRLDDAANAVKDGLALDGKATSSLVEVKHVIDAERLLRRGDKAGARAAASKVKADEDLRFLAALVLVAAGDDAEATSIAKSLSMRLGSDPRAYARLIEADMLRRRGKAREAMILAGEAIEISDMWHAHFLRGLAALDAGQTADAFSELQLCHKRRGEISLSINDMPGLRYALSTTYYLARAEEALGSPEAAATYRAFLATQVNGDPKDPLIADATARLAKLK